MITQKEINRRQEFFHQKILHERIDAPKIINAGGLYKGGGGTAAAAYIFATIVEAPCWGDSNAEQNSPEYDGRTYYICRLLSDTTAAYDTEHPYVTGDSCIAQNGLKYICASGFTQQSPNIGHEPSNSGLSYWTKDDEIKIEYAFSDEEDDGSAVPDFDIRLCNPGYPKGANVILFSRKVSEEIGTRYYIFGLKFAGASDEITILPDWSNDNAIMRAVMM